MIDRITQSLLLFASARANSATALDRRRLSAFKTLDADSARAAAEAERLWDALGDAAKISLERRPIAYPSSISRTRRVFLGASASAVAASLLASALAPPLKLWPSLLDLLADYRTGPGERKVLTLAGGVTADLNTRTTISKRGGSALDLRLSQGELVLTSYGQRVSLTAGKADISLSAGSFAIALDGENGTVTGLSGVTAVRAPHIDRSIREGDQVAFSPKEAQVVQHVDLETLTAWQHGLLIFKNETVGEIVKELNRYRPGHLFLVNPDLAIKRLTAQIKIDNIDAFVASLPLLIQAKQNHYPGGFVVIA